MNKSLKRLRRNAILMVLATIPMSIVLLLHMQNAGPEPTLPIWLGGRPEGAPAQYVDGTYTASKKGYLSEIVATVTISNGKLTSLEVDAAGETPAIGGAAAEDLTAEILRAGTVEGVDGISGATFTSNAVLAAAEACMVQAER